MPLFDVAIATLRLITYMLNVMGPGAMGQMGIDLIIWEKLDGA